MKAVEIVIGSILLTSGLAGPLTGAGDAGLFAGDVVGEAMFSEAEYEGGAWVETSEGALRMLGPVNASASAEQATVSVHRYRYVSQGVSVAGYSTHPGVKTESELSTATYTNVTVAVDGRSDGLVHVWPNDTGHEAWLQVALSPQDEAHVRASPATERVYAPDTAYSYQPNAPVVAFGHGQSHHGDVTLSEGVFDRFHASGGITIIVENALLAVEHAGGRETIDTDTQRPWTYNEDSIEETLEEGVVQEEVYASVTFPNGTFRTGFDERTQAAFLTNEPSVTVNGTVTFEAGRGELHAKEDRTLGNDTVQIAGNTTLALAALGSDDSFPVTAWSKPGATLEEPTIQAEFQGDADEVQVNGRSVEVPASPTVPDEVTLVSQLLGAFLLVWTLVKKVGPFAVALFNGNPLENRKRRRIFDLVKAQGMAYLREVERETGYPAATTAHHLSVLEKTGLLASIEHSRYRVFFIPSADFCRDEMERLAALADPTRRKLSQVIVEEGATTQTELAEQLGVHRSTVSRHLATLEEEGLVEHHGERDRRYEPRLLLRQWLERAFPDSGTG